VAKVAGIAGAENHLLRLLPELATRGFDIKVVVLGDDGPSRGFRDALAAAGIASQRVPIRAPWDPLTMRTLTVRLRDLRPDVVHTHLIHADVHGQAAAARAGVPLKVSSRHNTNPFRRRPWVRRFDRRALRRVDRVIAISRAVERFVVDVEGADPARVRVVPYGFDPPSVVPGARDVARRRLGVDDSSPVVGVFGRSVRQKGVDVLLDAWPEVLSTHPAARLVVVGDGPLRPRLERQSRRLGRAGRVIFAGWVDHAAGLMPGCDVIAIPSRWEGFGLVALEAMAAARPIVASRVGGLEEIVVAGVTGSLVAPEDPQPLAEALSRLLAEPAVAVRFGAAGLERLRTQFAVAAMVDGTEAVYRELLDGEPPGGPAPPSARTRR
jgi:glycosyltransferase involved in cell wall biosynthesis